MNKDAIQIFAPNFVYVQNECEHSVRHGKPGLQFTISQADFQNTYLALLRSLPKGELLGNTIFKKPIKLEYFKKT